MSLPARPTSALRNLLTSEASGGLALMASAALALAVANSPAAPVYFEALKAYLGPLSVLHWINDALMAVFFLLVGLEIKRELLDGRLRTWPDRILPGVAALGGMAAPALVYVAVNWHSPGTLRGWAIPAATDIAFALGVLALLGSRVPVSLKVFLTALAIIDDLGAVLIIAAFYTLETIKELLERRSRPRSTYLLCKPDGSRIGNPKKAFEGACRRAGIDDFRFHDLRHTYASWWVQDGGDLYRLSRILGHATLQMTARYGHLRTDDLHEELGRVGRRRSHGRSQERQNEAQRLLGEEAPEHPQW